MNNDKSPLREEIEKRVSELKIEKAETLKEYPDTSAAEQDVLAERNMRISMEIKSLTKLESLIEQEVKKRSVEFAEWIGREGFIRNGNIESWIYSTKYFDVFKNNTATTEELYNHYLKQ